MGKALSAIRNSFAVLATAMAMTANAQPTSGQPFFVPGPPKTAGVTDADLKQLDDYFVQAGKNFGQRAAEKCDPVRDGNGAGYFTNADIAKIATLDQLTPQIPSTTTIRFKALTAAIDKLGYTICMDNRMPDLGVNFSVNLQAKVIALSPKSFDGPPAMSAQQMSLSAALNSIASNTKNFSEEPDGILAGLSVPFIGGSNPRPQIAREDKELIKKLQPAPVKGAQIPYEGQKALDLWHV